VSVPSVLDGLFLAAYALLAVFLWQLGNRAEGRGRRDLLDITIVVSGLAPLCWQLLVHPLTKSATFSAALVTYLAYPVCVFALLAMTVRLAFVARRRTAPHLILAGWITLELAADLVFLRQAATGAYAYGQWWQALWILSAGCVAALALHPRLALLLDRQPSRTVVSSTRRLYVLSASLAVPLLTIAFAELVHQGDLTVLFPAAIGLLLVVLVSLRLSGLMVDNAEQGRVQVHLQALSHELAHQALHDPLTGLGNRLLFAERADHALAQRLTNHDRAAAVLLLDLDDFKTINDTFGHEAGDRVLVEVARRLEHIARRGEGAFRLGGDEFAFVLSNAHLQDALHLADRICTALLDPYDLGPREITPVATIGVALANNGQSRSTLLAEADMAMYEGKRTGATNPSVYDPVLHHAALDRHQLERDLRGAVAAKQLRVLYQPLVHLPTSEIVGVEALLRWEHPERGTVSPVEFIPIAEANGSILAIGDWVLTESLRQLAVWDLAQPDRQLRMSVNVSPRQLADSEFVERARRILDASGVEPGRVNLEITEAAFGADVEAMIARLHDLKRLGVTLAIDDFGTEYSSLAHLRRLPVDVLKIDKSFVAGIATEPAEWALTTAIIRLADSLGTTTVAEGIETGG
jgi:diguanylate cyclase (GGDEF)-like protein